MRAFISQLTGLLLSVMFMGLPSYETVARSEVLPAQVRPSALKRLGYFLQSESREVRAEFATLALGKMIAAYEIELEKLNVPGKHSLKETHKRRRWAQALSQYLDYLYAFDEVINQAPNVEIIADQPGPLQLLSGEFLLPITAPRIAKPELLENDIISAFCSVYLCNPQALNDPIEQVSPPRAHSGWSFRAGYGSTYQTLDGLSFMFNNIRQKALKEQICLRISKQLRLLADALLGATQQGRVIDWHYLKILSRAQGDKQLVLLSAQTPALHLALPDLALAPVVLDIAKPWLQAQLQNKTIEQFFPGTDLLFSKLIERRN